MNNKEPHWGTFHENSEKNKSSVGLSEDVRQGLDGGRAGVWRRVEDELPSEKKRILLYIKGNIVIGWLDKGYWAWGYCYHTFDQCKHWMPLPKPPNA
ncbi:DUF551 domain-containing protein [bacterium]|nr:DUF551 domain-containing protein [bacterium]